MQIPEYIGATSYLSPTVGVLPKDLFCTTEPPPRGFIWDDIVFIARPFQCARSFRLKWLRNDEYLLKQISPKGRCSYLKLDGQPLPHGKPSLNDPSHIGGLTHTPNLFRLTGFVKSRIFSPQVRLKPSHAASSISVVCNYRDNSTITLRLIKSLSIQATRSPVEVILVNNQSSAEELRKVQEGAEEILKPVGFNIVHINYDGPFNHSAQCNIAAGASTGDTLVMVNNDATFLARDALQELADWAHTPGIATAGARIIGDGGRLISAGIEIIAKHKGGEPRIRESECAPLSRVVRHTAGNSFCCAAITKATWQKLGGLRAEVFPTQYNDADFVIRCLDAGLRHIYIGHISIYHEPGMSESRTRELVEALHARLLTLHPHMGAYESEAPILIPVKKRPPGTTGIKRIVWIGKELVVTAQGCFRGALVVFYRKIMQPVLRRVRQS